MGNVDLKQASWAWRVPRRRLTGRRRHCCWRRRSLGRAQACGGRNWARCAASQTGAASQRNIGLQCLDGRFQGLTVCLLAAAKRQRTPKSLLLGVSPCMLLWTWTGHAWSLQGVRGVRTQWCGHIPAAEAVVQPLRRQSFTLGVASQRSQQQPIQRRAAFCEARLGQKPRRRV